MEKCIELPINRWFFFFLGAARDNLRGKFHVPSASNCIFGISYFSYVILINLINESHSVAKSMILFDDSFVVIQKQ